MLTTPAKRRQLRWRRPPYRTSVAGAHKGRHLLYRKPRPDTPGTWIAQVVVSGVRREHVLGQADDAGCGPAALTYPQAVIECLAWCEQQARLVAEAAAQAAAVPTVGGAIAEYIEIRKRRSAQDGENAEGRLTRHVLDTQLAGIALNRVTAGDLARWRSAIPILAAGDEAPVRSRDALRPATVNRLLNDLRAALLAAVARHRQLLPERLAGDIRHALRAEADAAEARQHPYLPPADLRRLIEAALAESEDFGRLVWVLAETGARFSQAIRLRCADLITTQAGWSLLMPSSRKGRAARARPPKRVPITEDLAQRLEPARTGRHGHETLLTWEPRGVGVTETGRQPWRATSQMDHQWGRALVAAGLPEKLTSYALRHSSIVRGLSAGTPAEAVAALHDTSLTMLRRTYAANLATVADEAARRALVSLAPSKVERLRAAG